MGYKFTDDDNAAMAATLEAVEYVETDQDPEGDLTDPDLDLESIIERAQEAAPGSPEFEEILAEGRTLVGVLLKADPDNESLKEADSQLEQLQVTNWETDMAENDSDILTTDRVVSLVASTSAVDCGCDGEFATGDTPTPDTTKPLPSKVRWAGILGMEADLTGDGRYIQPEAVRWERLPIPLRMVSADVGAHSGAQVVGRIDEVERISVEAANERLIEMGQEPLDYEGDSVRVLWGAGDFDLGNEVGREAARVVDQKFQNGVSMDLDDVAFEVRIAADAPALMTGDPAELVAQGTPDSDGRVKVQEMAPDDEVMVTTDARMRAATIVAVPAFNRALIYVVPEESLVASARPVPAKMTITLRGQTMTVYYDQAQTFNWVEDVGGLPKYIKRIADAIQKKGKAEGHAIAIAVNAVKKMCATGDINFPGKQDVNAGSRAEACAAAAEWEEKKARAKADSATTASFTKVADVDEEPVEGESDEEDKTKDQIRVPEGNPTGGQWMDTPWQIAQDTEKAVDGQKLSREEWEAKRLDLRKAIREAAEALKGLKVGSDEYEAAVKELLDVMKRANDEMVVMTEDPDIEDIDKNAATALIEALDTGAGGLIEYLDKDWSLLDDDGDIGKDDEKKKDTEMPKPPPPKNMAARGIAFTRSGAVRTFAYNKDQWRDNKGRWVDMPNVSLDKLAGFFGPDGSLRDAPDAVREAVDSVVEQRGGMEGGPDSPEYTQAVQTAIANLGAVDAAMSEHASEMDPTDLDTLETQIEKAGIDLNRFLDGYIPAEATDLTGEQATDIGAEPTMTPAEIRQAIAKAEKDANVWQGGDTEEASKRTKANRLMREAEIEELKEMLPEGEPESIGALRKMIRSGNSDPSEAQLREAINSFGGQGYISDGEYKERRVWAGKLAEKMGFKPSAPKDEGAGRKTTDLGNGWTMQEEDPKRSWGGTRTVRDENGKQIEALRRESTSSYLKPEEMLQAIGEYLAQNPEIQPKAVGAIKQAAAENEANPEGQVNLDDGLSEASDVQLLQEIKVADASGDIRRYMKAMREAEARGLNVPIDGDGDGEVNEADFDEMAWSGPILQSVGEFLQKPKGGQAEIDTPEGEKQYQIERYPDGTIRVSETGGAEGGEAEREVAELPADATPQQVVDAIRTDFEGFGDLPFQPGDIINGVVDPMEDPQVAEAVGLWEVSGAGDDLQAAVSMAIAWADENGYPRQETLDALFGDSAPVVDEKGLTAAAPPVDLDAPPVAHFSNPNFKMATPMTITKDGRVMGHLAVWGTCHISHTNAGKCIVPPKSGAGYAYFATGSVLTKEGAEIGVGQITLGTGHANEAMNAKQTLAHYDNTGTAVADIVVGEDAYGIWYSGSLRPGVTAKQVRSLRAHPLSGDWRRLAGNLELVATLCVNVQGFPVPRPKGLVASGQMQTLTAAGMLPPRKVRRPGTPGALSADDLRYLKRLAERERHEESMAQMQVLDKAASLAASLRSTKEDKVRAMATRLRVEALAARLRSQ